MAFDRALTLLPGNKLKDVSRRDIVMALIKVFSPFKVSVQFGYDCIRVVFENAEGKGNAVKNYSVHLCGKYIKVDGGGQPILSAVLFDYPFEGPEEPVRRALEGYGEYKGFHFQNIPYDDVSIYTGTRLIRMVLDEDVAELPREINIGGYYCRLWHRGQTMLCHICNEEGHKASNCPFKGKCLRCKGEGHMSRNCPSRSDHVPAAPAAGGGSNDYSLPANEVSGEAKSASANPGGDGVAQASNSVHSNSRVSQTSDLRDNQLDELSDSPNLFGSVAVNVAPPEEASSIASLGDKTQDSPDVGMSESCTRKRSLSSSSDSGSVELEVRDLPVSVHGSAEKLPVRRKRLSVFVK